MNLFQPTVFSCIPLTPGPDSEKQMRPYISFAQITVATGPLWKLHLLSNEWEIHPPGGRVISYFLEPQNGRQFLWYLRLPASNWDGIGHLP